MTINLNVEEFHIKILNAIMLYMQKHPTATTCGGEYIYQDDKAQVDAIELASDLGEIFIKHPKYQINS